MKKLVVLYIPSKSGYAHESCFDNKSAIDRSNNWAHSLGDTISVEVINREDLNSSISELHALLLMFNTLIKKHNASSIVFSWADCPFLNKTLSLNVIDYHDKYKAEYSFAEGYPYGLSPEVIHADTINILLQLAETKKDVIDYCLQRDSIFSLIKTDINSFEIESYMSDNDYRYLRAQLNCSNKRNFISCKNLFDAADSKIENVFELCEIVKNTASVQRTVPAFVNIQIKNTKEKLVVYEPDFSECEMDIKEFKNLVKRVSDFCGDAVISLSFLSDPLYHSNFLDFAKEVLSYDNLSLVVETDARKLNQNMIDELKKCVEKNPIKTTNQRALNWIIRIDAIEPNLYKTIHPICSNEDDFISVEHSVELLQVAFPHAVYPQFVRMNSNEDHLEGFFRKWTKVAKSDLIIQKYDHVSNILPDERPTDLSPINRYACWHIKRDMNVLSDGAVVRCKAAAFDKDNREAVLGNAFTEDLDIIWKRGELNLVNQLEGKFIGQCGDSDEYYTFNF